MNLNCYLLPELFRDEQIEGVTAVVIDVLRATTTITSALAHGASQVVACLEVDEARREAAKFSPDERLLGGERGCEVIDGFDLGNSPGQYTSQIVSGKTIVFTTTNGTKAMLRCHAADRVLLAAFVNLSALCQEIADDEQIALICAGTHGEITREDVLLAGAIVDRLETDMSQERMLNDQAVLARDAHRAAGGELEMLLAESRGGRNVAAAGMQQDIAAAARVDQFSVVPEFNAKTRCIRVV